MELAKLKKPDSPKERNLIKGALRRVFSRSELRRLVLSRAIIPNMYDSDRPRVTKWALCEECRQFEPAYLMQVDHIIPVVPLDKSLDDMTWDEVVNNLWCNIDNLSVKCKKCHKEKSKIENAERRRIKKETK